VSARESDSTPNRLTLSSGSLEAYDATTYDRVRRRAGRIETSAEKARDARTGTGANPRYYASARSDRGRRASGFHDAQLHTAIGLVHWEEFDK
jgi:hypothetical protein